VQSGDVKAGWDIGDAYGLTWEVTRDPIGTLTGLSKGAFHHGGAFSTFGYIDPKKDLIGVYMTQWAGADGNIPRETFVQMGAASIIE
jgi:CubicO group peptidase (beta-lactamase class C family)